MIIAVDGPTASGKGTIARELARRFGLPHLDTGLLYRAVGHCCRLAAGDPDNEADALAACEFPDTLLADPVLREEGTGALASRVSVHSAVRRALYERQRTFAMQEGGAVLDGRDIGTVIVPEAGIKLFVTASADARAERRYHEMLDRGVPARLEEVKADILRRDARDMNRRDSPLVPAQDAYIVDTTAFARDDAVALAVELVEDRLRR
jgi:cytidylate kinase